MALYTVTNLTKGTVVLPPPLGKRLDKYETINISAPAGMTEANLNRKYSPLARMIQTGMISVKTVEDVNIDDNVEVATVSMLRGGSSGVNSFDAAFTGLLVFGDIVYVKPDSSVALVDVTDQTKVPAAGMVVGITGPTATIQTSGTVTGLSGLVAGKQHFVGLTGQAVYPPPWPTPGNSLFHQLIGTARSSSILLLDPINVMTRVR
jgi:hypothetical protein